MKGSWIYLGIAILTLGLINNFVLRVIISLIWILFLYVVLGKRKIIKVIICLFVFILFSFPLKFNVEKVKVKEIKNGYYIVGNLLNNVLLYTDTKLGLDDVLIIDGSINDITTTSNFERYTYVDYCKGKNIIGSINLDNVEIIKEGKTLRRLIYDHNVKYDNLWINQLLFGSYLDTESNLKYLVISSGMHISALFSMIKTILKRYYYDKQATQITLFIAIIFGFIFHFPYGLVRSAIGLMLSLVEKDKKDRTGQYIFLLALYQPYYCYNIGFLLPCLNRLLNCFSYNHNKIKRLLLIIVTQLFVNGYCDVLSCLFFGIIRYLFSFLYCLGLICSILTLHIPISFETLFSFFTFKSIYITNQIGIVFLISIFILLSLNNCKYLIIVSLLLMINNYRNYIYPFYSVTYLDVGQGDCAVISVPYSKKALLIDTGGSNYTNIGKKIVVPYLLRNGYTDIEVIISHYDIDHSGSLEYLKSNLNVVNVYDSKNDIVFKSLEILSLNNEAYEDDNDNSLVSFFRINDYNFLFMGDVSKQVEEKLVRDYGNLKIDVCKISHHGSNSATSELFLSSFKIKYALISSGKENVYHHPNINVVNRLSKYKIEMLKTQEEGGIRFFVYKKWLVFLTSKGTVGL